jgi:TetR/AcrR family transcriptional regulator, cholesterol catabolism regulator
MSAISVGAQRAESDPRHRSVRWQKQRDKILAVAGRLFWQKGYLGTSIDEIAKAAGVNKASIYYYFKNKTEILYEVASNELLALDALVAPIAKSNASPGEKLRGLVAAHLGWQMARPGIAGIGQIERRNLTPKLLRSYVAMRDDYEAIVREIVRQGVALGEFRDVDPKLASLFILGVVNSVTQWYRPGGDFSIEAVTSEANRFIKNALEPGL